MLDHLDPRFPYGSTTMYRHRVSRSGAFRYSTMPSLSPSSSKRFAPSFLEPIDKWSNSLPLAYTSYLELDAVIGLRPMCAKNRK